jgi:hypothetical protein
MKEIFKLVIWFIVTTFLLSLILWSAESFIPLFGKLINTIEITTNYDITFCDYLISVFGFEIIGILLVLMKCATENFLE